MPFPTSSGRKRMRLSFAAVLGAGLLAPAMALASPSNIPMPFAAPQPSPTQQLPQADIGGAPRMLVAQNQQQQASQVTVRVQQLEEQVRNLTGQIDGLTFQLTQMQTLMQKMQDDNEFRFQALEGGKGAQGGAGGKSDAVIRSGGAKPAGVSPQTTTITVQPPANAAADMGQMTPQDMARADGSPVDLGATDSDTVDNNGDIGPSSDPLLGHGKPGEPTDQAVAPLGSPDNSGQPRPLDLSLGGGGKPVDGDATAQYKAGYEAVVRGDYTFAEEQFKQFIQLYPKDPQAPDATNWLGEALLQRGAYDEAADVLVTGFKNYPTAARAPDILLKLGIALNGADEQAAACKTFGEIGKRYPNVTPAFKKRLGEEAGKAKCPA
ncbi:MAG: ygbF [Hyphomicrobiales bacterium]|nr:ygbF [Hyphomicrobiales bacterium]